MEKSGHDHSHGHSHDHEGRGHADHNFESDARGGAGIASTAEVNLAETEANQRKLKRATMFVLVFFVIEVIGGLWSGSLAIISDAAHLLADISIGSVARNSGALVRRDGKLSGKHTVVKRSTVSLSIAGLNDKGTKGSTTTGCRVCQIRHQTFTEKLSYDKKTSTAVVVLEPGTDTNRAMAVPVWSTPAGCATRVSGLSEALVYCMAVHKMMGR